MAFSHDKERSIRPGHGVGHNGLQEYHINLRQDPMLDGSDDSGLLMGPQGLTEERCVDPRIPAWDHAAPGGTGLQDFSTADHFHPQYDTSGYPQSSGNDSPSYLNSTYLDASGDDLGMSA